MDCVLLQRDNLPSFLLSPPPSVKQERGYKASSGRCCRAVPAKRVLSGLPPPGLGSAELTERGTAFGRIVHFNRSVFSPFYAPILRKLLFPPGRGQDQGGSRQAEGDPDPPPPPPGEPQHEVLFECFVTEC
ncbi:T-complex protein 11 [Dissostichus eleginoides]|uniref:T-complex protein 11 n=1 Tax=Dissostichus eleginoides TaxID=100907 RepID=A0AAD9CHB2_DISEL|nr:T-complex protein 11 [Dissostichus eleginoides]